MLSLLSGEILRLCLACSTKLTTACKPRCFCSWGPPPRVSACWSPRSSHRASGSPTPGEGMVVCMYVCMYVCMDGWMYGCMYVCMDVWMYFTCRTSLASLPIVHINAARNGLQHLQHWKLQGQKKKFNLSASEKNPCLGWLFMSTLRTSLEELEAFAFFFTWETEHRGFAFPVGKELSSFPV